MKFVHLHLHTQYSLLDGAIRIDPLMERTREYGMDAVAITDHGTMHGVVEFYEKAVKAGIRPIIGCEFYVAPRGIGKKSPIDRMGEAHLVLLAENGEGYKNMCKMASIAQLEGYFYRPRIDKELLAAHCEGLIATSACMKGEIPALILKTDMEGAEKAALSYQGLLGEGNFFLEVQHNGIRDQERINEGLLDLSERLSIPLVATNDCHYLDKQDASAHEVLLCVHTRKTIHDPTRFRFDSDQLYYKSPAEMESALGRFPGAIENTVEIANRCHVDLDLGTYHFPVFDPESELPADRVFEQEAREGFERRLETIRARRSDFDERTYRDRLDYEIGIIQDMGFSDYFLIVADFISYARENGVPVGPGRGSAAGSLVAYALEITGVDPLEHGLIFERFLNPERISMPDIDVDFCIHGREKIFKYVVEKYGGRDYVAQIITFGKLRARAVIRDVGRALGIPSKKVDEIAKMVPDEKGIELADALRRTPELRIMAERNPQVGELIRISRILEGLPRHASTHAAGVVIADRPLVDYLPLYRGKSDEVVTTQFDMDMVGKIGLIKFDFLSLRNLTVIQKTMDLIRERGETPPDLESLDLEDADTYRLLSAGDTAGVFQLEGSGMRGLLERLKPARFEDITALLALYRPGPLSSGMVEDFVERKHGRQKVEYLLPELAPILEETYGVILYQEQVMKMAGVLASYSMAEADKLRKAMGKKNAETMALQRERFVKGAVGKGHPEEKAAQLFDLMEKFSGYGFNKSHSAAYALIAYQTAYLKAHFPLEFMASLLTNHQDSKDNVVKLMNECRAMNIPVLPPDINSSGKDFSVQNGKIRFGLAAIMNVGKVAVEEIVSHREKGPYAGLADFRERTSGRTVNKRCVEALIKAGAFDCTGWTRSDLLSGLQRKRSAIEQPRTLVYSGEGTRPVSKSDIRAEMEDEKTFTGGYFTESPFRMNSVFLTKGEYLDIQSLSTVPSDRYITFAGIIEEVREVVDKSGRGMAFLTISDERGSIEAVAFPKVYPVIKSKLDNPGDLNIFKAKTDVYEGKQSIQLNNVITIADIKRLGVDIHIRLRLDSGSGGPGKFEDLKSILGRHKGGRKVFIHYEGARGERYVFPLKGCTVTPGNALKDRIDRLLGYDATMFSA